MTKVAGIDLSSVHNVSEVLLRAADPTETDAGAVGDEWYNTDTGAVFKCTDDTAGAMVWSQFVAPDGRKAKREAAAKAAEEAAAHPTNGEANGDRPPVTRGNNPEEHNQHGRTVPRHPTREGSH